MYNTENLRVEGILKIRIWLSDEDLGSSSSRGTVVHGTTVKRGIDDDGVSDRVVVIQLVQPTSKGSKYQEEDE